MSKGNFLSLQISQEEILQAAHLTNESFKAIQAVYHPHYAFNLFSGCILISVVPSIFLSFVFVALGALFIPSRSSDELNIAITLISVFLTITIAWTVYFFVEKTSKKPWKKFMTLYQQVQNYNSLLDAVDALDEAQRSGGTKRLNNKEQMIEAFTIMRADLICALRIEKTFRENPQLRSTDFHMNLEPLKILQISEEASQYGDLFGQALQIGMSVQQEMQALQKKP